MTFSAACQGIGLGTINACINGCSGWIVRHSEKATGKSPGGGRNDRFGARARFACLCGAVIMAYVELPETYRSHNSSARSFRSGAQAQAANLSLTADAKPVSAKSPEDGLVEVPGGSQITRSRIWSARYSDARIESDRIVIVGFCHPQVTKAAPSTTNRFLMSWL
jgi:hypothetical protein